MKKIVFILLIFCSFLVVWGCNKNKTKCVPQKEATSDSSMRSNDDTLSLMIEHEVDDVDYGVIIKRGDKTIHRFGYKCPEDDDLVPNGERIDSCILADINFDGIKEDVLFYLGSFGASGTEYFDACVWNPKTEHYDKIEEFKDIPNPKISVQQWLTTTKSNSSTRSQKINIVRHQAFYQFINSKLTFWRFFEALGVYAICTSKWTFMKCNESSDAVTVCSQAVTVNSYQWCF